MKIHLKIMKAGFYRRPYDALGTVLRTTHIRAKLIFTRSLECIILS